MRAACQGLLQIHLLPVGGAIDLRVNLRQLLLHHSPGRRGDEELFVDAVPEAVGDPACVEGEMEQQVELKQTNNMAECGDGRVPGRLCYR